MGKSENERKSIDTVLRKVKYFRGYSVVDESERPDFIVSNNQHNVGLEHCLIDMTLDGAPFLEKNKPPASVSRQNEKRINCLYEKYCGKNILGHEKEALSGIENIVNDYLPHARMFDLTLFEYAWRHGILSHKGKSKCYRSKLSADDKLGLVCEVVLPSEDYEWLLQEHYDERPHIQRICGLPMTRQMRDVMFEALLPDGFDFIIIVTRFSSFETAKVKMYDSISMSCALVCDSFAPYRGRLDLSCSLSLCDSESSIRRK